MYSIVERFGNSTFHDAIFFSKKIKKKNHFSGDSSDVGGCGTVHSDL